MTPYALRLTEDRFDPGAAYSPPLAPLCRVLYVRSGDLVITSGGSDSHVSADGAWHGAGGCAGRAGPRGALVLRYELVGNGRPSGDHGVTSTVLLQHPIDLDPTTQYLMRCDRVDFSPGGVALPHRHKGGGIRCLIEGELEVRVGDAPGRVIQSGQAWFESGIEPVYAVASRELATSFIRVSILPRVIKGQSSIMYVDPADAQRGKPRHYTVYADEPIEIGR